MGLFSGIKKAVGSVVGSITGGDILGAAGSALGFLGQERANDATFDIAAMNNATALDLAKNRYQYQVKDLSAAGLNPMLGYLKGDSMSMPSLSSPKAENSGAAAIQGAQLALLNSQAKQAEANANLSNAQALEVEARTPTHALGMELTREQINKLGYETANILANTHLTNAQTDKVFSEISQIALQGDLTIQSTKEALARTNLTNAQINEVAPRIQKIWADVAYTRAATWQETKGLLGNFAKGFLDPSSANGTLGHEIGVKFSNSARDVFEKAKPTQNRYWDGKSQSYKPR